MLDFKPALLQLQDSQKFKDYQKANINSYLTTSLYIDDWQINYFSPNTHQITSFIVNKNVKKETLKSENKKFPKLNSKIDTDLEEVLDIIKKFNKNPEAKKIIILQTEKEEPIWNITIPLPTLKVINIKISATSGEIINNTEKSIVELR